MNTILMTDEFLQWLSKLKDLRAKAMILTRIDRAKKGNFGDCKRLSENLYEMRISLGAGYRIYYTEREKTIYLVLAGGDKKTQPKDIEDAHILIAELD